jgi:hypothetical protein
MFECVSESPIVNQDIQSLIDLAKRCHLTCEWLRHELPEFLQAQF